MSDRTHVEPNAPAHESDTALARINAEDLATAFTLGTDSERHAALTKALQYDIELPPDLLINAYVNDPSDDVRLLAFTTYIDSQSDDWKLYGLHCGRQRITRVQSCKRRPSDSLTN